MFVDGTVVDRGVVEVVRIGVDVVLGDLLLGLQRLALSLQNVGCKE